MLRSYLLILLATVSAATAFSTSYDTKVVLHRQTNPPRSDRRHVTGHRHRTVVAAALRAAPPVIAATSPRKATTGILLMLPQRPQQTAAAFGLAIIALLPVEPAAAVAGAGEELFTAKCAGCHMGGGNVIARGKTLSASDLIKNSVSSPDQIAALITDDKGAMPGFGETCAPKGQCTFGPRLSDSDIRDVTAFVDIQAAAGW